jgi:threonine aldolase
MGTDTAKTKVWKVGAPCGAAIHSGALQNALTPKNGTHMIMRSHSIINIYAWHHLTLKDIEPHVVFGNDVQHML